MSVTKGDSPPLDTPFLADAEMFFTLADAIFPVAGSIVVGISKCHFIAGQRCLGRIPSSGLPRPSFLFQGKFLDSSHI